MSKLSRRDFVSSSAGIALATFGYSQRAAASDAGSRMSYGLVTYQWAREWDLPTLIENCETAKVYGVELRTTHSHGVERTLNKQQREEVKQRFASSEVKLVGIGSNERYDNPDPAVVIKAIDATKDFIRLSHDVGGSGVKVKPDRFYDNVPHEQTIEQIGKALNELGAYGESFGQQIRLEVHGGCAAPPTIAAIMKVADHRNVAVCWNSNPQDLQGEGLEHNFSLLIKRFGATCHVRPLGDKNYPYQQLIDLLVQADYDGWVMLEDGRIPENPVERLAEEAVLFKQMVRDAQERAA